MSKKIYGKDIKLVNAPVKMYLPNGKQMLFDNSEEALKWFDESQYANSGSMVEHTPVQGDAENPIELNEIQVTGKGSNKPQISRTGVDLFLGANYSPRYNETYTQMGNNPINWTKFIPANYWESKTHQALRDTNDVIAGAMSLPLLYTVPEVAGALNLAGAYEGTKNLISDDGVKKTVNLFKEGKYKEGLKSAGGDAFNVALTLPVLNKLRAGFTPKTVKLANEMNKSLKETEFEYPSHPSSSQANNFFGQIKSNRSVKFYTNNGIQTLDKGTDNIDLNQIRFALKYLPGYEKDAKVANMDRVNNFIQNDILPRLKAQGHDISKTHIPQLRKIDPNNDYMDAILVKGNSGAWYTPAFDDVTLRTDPENVDFGLLVHETGGHGIRYNLGKLSKANRDLFNNATKNAGFKLGEFPQFGSIGREEVFNPEETNLLREAYPQVERSAKKGHELNEQGAVNTLLRAKLSLRNGYVTGKDLDNVIENTSPGEILQMEIDQPYTSSIVNDIAEITGKDADDIRWMNSEELTQLAELHPQIKKMTDNVKKTMMKVGAISGAVWGLNRNE